MQLRACLGLALLALGACVEIPKGISLWVDGTTVEYRKAPEPEPEPAPEPAPTDTDDPQR